MFPNKSNGKKIIRFQFSSISETQITAENIVDTTNIAIVFFSDNGTQYHYTCKTETYNLKTTKIIHTDIIPHSMIFTEHVGSKSFILKNLPTSKPSKPNYIWKDAEGFLRIT